MPEPVETGRSRALMMPVVLLGFIYSGVTTPTEAAAIAAAYAFLISAFLYRMGRLRNGDPEMEHVRISEDDVPALFAFLNALNNKGERVATPTPLNTPPDPVGDYYRSPGERRY